MQENWGPGYVKESLMSFEHMLKRYTKAFLHVIHIYKCTNQKITNTKIHFFQIVHFEFPLTFFKMSRHFWLQLVIISFPLQMTVPFPNLTSMHSKNDKITKLYYTTKMMHKIYF